MSWLEWAQLAMGAYSARRSERAEKDESRFKAQMEKEAVPLQGYEARRTREYEMALQDQYAQKNKERKAKAFQGLARQQGIVPQGYQFQNVIDIPILPENPVPNDPAYQRVSGLSPTQRPGG